MPTTVPRNLTEVSFAYSCHRVGMDTGDVVLTINSRCTVTVVAQHISQAETNQEEDTMRRLLATLLIWVVIFIGVQFIVAIPLLALGGLLGPVEVAILFVLGGVVATLVTMRRR